MIAHLFRSNAVGLMAVLFACAGCGRDAGKNGEAGVEVAPEDTDGKAASAANDPTLVPFAKAVLLEPPDGANRPPDKTAGGKSTVNMFEMTKLVSKHLK